MRINDGGPAFPAPEASISHFDSAGVYTGMTLRDYFATHTEESKLTHWQAELLLGKFNGSLYEDDGTTSLEYIVWFEDAKAKFRYLKAEAMLKARENK